MKETAVRKGKCYEIRISGMGSGAEGVGEIDGYKIFVPGALPDETVRVMTEEVRQSYARASLKGIINAARDRVPPECQVYDACGGCQMQHMSYAAQLEMKRRTVEDAIRRIGHISGVPVHPVIGMSSPWEYRNKMQFPAGRGIDNRPLIGCFAAGSHEIIDTPSCLIQKSENNQILSAMRNIIGRLGIRTYDEDRHTGTLRHVMGRVGYGGETMAVLVTATEELRHRQEIVRMLREKVPNLVSVQQNIQTHRGNVILGRDTRILWGKRAISDRVCGLSFDISPRSFFQVNTSQADVLYKKVLEYAELSGRETVVDAYCGVGSITLPLARAARMTFGVEIVPQAIYDARLGAMKNGIKPVEFIIGDAAEVIPHLGVRPDVIVVDPPRAGCAASVLKTFAEMGPERIIYVSCNPATLARDLAILAEKGYRAEEIQPVDMFPHTSHIECVTKIVK